MKVKRRTKSRFKRKKTSNSSQKTIRGSHRLKISGLAVKVLIILAVSTVLICGGIWLKARYDKGVNLYVNYQPVFAPGDNINEYSEISLNDSFNLLLVGLDREDSGHIKSDAVLLAHYDSTAKIFQIIGLPVKTCYFLEVEDKWMRLNDVYAVGQLRTPAQGMEYLIQVIEDSLAMSIDGYVAADFDAITRSTDTLGKLSVQNDSMFLDNDLEIAGLRSEFGSGTLRLSSDDVLAFAMADEGGYLSQMNRLYSLINSSANVFSRALAYKVLGSFDDINDHIYSNLSGDTIRSILALVESQKSLSVNTYIPTDIVSNQEVNGNLLTIFDRVKFDDYIVTVIENQEILKEQARIEIYNGTNQNGLASKYSRRVKNFGGDVIRVANKNTDLEYTIFFIPDVEQFPKTISRLQSIFPEAQIIEDYPNFTVTGDITVLLAEDAVGI